MTLYPTTYIDNFGKEETLFLSNGKYLKIKIRNHIFIGQSFDSLELQSSEEITNNTFSYNENASLTNCCFDIKFPILAKRNSEILNAFLNVKITLESSENTTTKLFALTVDNKLYDLLHGKVSGLWFENQMIQLQRLLPLDTRINSCLFCAYSNYGVSGSDNFGTLLCFKDIKDKIIEIKDKSEYIDITENNCFFPTQETFWCSEFKEIDKNQWQYKDLI